MALNTETKPNDKNTIYFPGKYLYFNIIFLVNALNILVTK